MLTVKFSKKWVFILSVLVGLIATAGSIKTWGTSDTLTAADLNANFQHIHNLMVGSHGARLLDSDVNANANIQQSKIASYHLFPVAWANVHVTAGAVGGGPCTAGTCGLYAQQFSQATWSATGNYILTFTTPRTDNTYEAIATPRGANLFCSQCGTSTTLVNICCTNNAGTATNAEFDVQFYDDN